MWKHLQGCLQGGHLQKWSGTAKLASVNIHHHSKLSFCYYCLLEQLIVSPDTSSYCRHSREEMLAWHLASLGLPAMENAATHPPFLSSPQLEAVTRPLTWLGCSSWQPKTFEKRKKTKENKTTYHFGPVQEQLKTSRPPGGTGQDLACSFAGRLMWQ